MSKKINRNIKKTFIKNEAPISNGFADAIGFGSGPFGSTSPPGNGVQPIADSNTAFSNLRWYLISNFRQLLSELFIEIGLVQTIVCVPVDDGLRGGVMFKSKQLNEQQLKDLQLDMDRDDDLSTAGWAAKWCRLYGGGGILILVDDQDPESPLNIEAITPESKVSFKALDMWELFWDKQNVEGYDEVMQQQDFDFFNYYSIKVHKSRVLRLKGVEAPSFVRPRLRGWGLSCVEPLIRSLNQYLKATDLGFEVLDEFKLDVYKIKNLVDTLLSPGGTAKIKERVQMANWQKNYQNAIVMDSEDEFDHKQLSFAGLAEAMTGIRMQVAADMRMPITKLFGTSVSSGFQTDQNDMENYNSMVEAEVRGKLRFHILKMGEIKCQKLFGMIPDDLECEFKPLRELSAIDQENVKTQKFSRLMQAKQSGDISTQEFRDAINKGNIFDVQLDTAEDGLNANEDPELNQIVSEDAAEELDEDNLKKEEESKTGKDESLSTKVRNGILTYNAFDLIKRLFNSPEFDKASYEADGGPNWMEPYRIKSLVQLDHIIKDPMWVSAENASIKSLGNIDPAFCLWWFAKNGGKI